GWAGMPPRPSGANGSGASRVHSTTPSAVGSPEATPRVKGSPVQRGARYRAPETAQLPASAAADATPPNRNSCRRDRPMSHGGRARSTATDPYGEAGDDIGQTFAAPVM